MFKGISYILISTTVGIWLAAGSAFAQAEDLLRGILGNLAVQTIQKQTVRVRVPAASGALNLREDNRRIQEALNRQGFDSGVADGILGKRSYAAIARFQGANGYAATGTLTAGQKAKLLGSAGNGSQISILPIILPTELGGTVPAQAGPPVKSDRSLRRALLPLPGTGDGSAVTSTRSRATTSRRSRASTLVQPAPGSVASTSPTTRGTAGVIPPNGSKTGSTAGVRQVNPQGRTVPPTRTGTAAPAGTATGAAPLLNQGVQRVLCTPEMISAGTCTDPLAVRRARRAGGG